MPRDYDNLEHALYSNSTIPLEAQPTLNVPADTVLILEGGTWLTSHNYNNLNHALRSERIILLKGLTCFKHNHNAYDTYPLKIVRSSHVQKGGLS